MTVQIQDKIIINNIECLISLDCNISLFIPHNHKKIQCTEFKYNTGFKKRFLSTWEIINDRIFLIDIYGCYKRLFKNKLFAKWFNGIMVANINGNDNLSSVFCEEETDMDAIITQYYFEIRDGKVIDKKIVFKRKYNFKDDLS
jgi:hypothetical protein